MSYLNRLSNCKNPYQGNFKKVLAVCSAGLLRSPSIAFVASNPPFSFNTRAVGTSQDYALIPIDSVHVEWADEIICAHEDQIQIVKDLIKKLEEEYGEKKNKPIHCLDIDDIYKSRSAELLKIIDRKLRLIYPPKNEQ